MEGKYEPQSPKIGKFFTIGLHDRQIHDVLRNQKCKILCINDTENIGDFRQQKRNIKDSKIYGKAGLFRNDPALYRSFYDKNRAAGHWKADCAFWKSKEKPACV